MGKLGDLVVRIGADTRDLNKSLGKVQRNMRSMTSNFTALGTQMTKAVTLPILGIGAMAIKSAADLEKMEVSFISLTGGAEQAGAMMQQLNEFTAKTPFQIDAVATSARQLIASGTGIGEVNEQLQFLGDIAATTGQPINEIAAIFAKVNAKGKVELENLNQLAERGIPVFKGLADATGLLPSELGAGAVTVKQFNDYLKSLSEEGGMANGAMERLSETATGKFSTALDNLKLAGAAMAEELLPVVNSLLDRVVELAQGFTALSPKMKHNILVFAGLAASIGPLIVAIPKIIAGIKLIGIAFTTSMPHILAATIAISAISLLFIDTSSNSSRAAKSIKKVEKALKDLSQAELYIEAGVRHGAGIKQIERAIEFSEKLAETARTEMAAIQAAADARGRGMSFTQKEEFTELRKFAELHERIIKANKLLKETLKDPLDSGVTDSTEEVEIFGSEIERLLVSFTQMPGAVLESKKAIVQLTDALGQTFNVQNTDALLGFLNDFSVATDDIAEGAEAIEFKFQGVATAMGTMFGEMVSGAQTGAEAFKSFAKNAISSVIAMAKANVIAAATNPLSPWNIAGGGLLAPAFALAGLSALDALLANIPALAGGGLAYGPSLAMVGDNRNASIDPEVIAPLSKLKDMMGASTVQVYGRISGDDIVISNSRASRDRNRF